MKKVFLGILAYVLIVSFAFAEVGVSDTEVVVGQSAALTGPSQDLGQGMKKGMEIYFKEINSQGGVNGRKIRLISLDDGYEPDQCAVNTRKLIDEQGVFALLGYVGTPTAKVAVPIIESEKVPFIGAFTGAGLLRTPLKHYVINCRASYDDETEGLVHYLVDKLGIKKIACFYQDDSYGRAGLEGTAKALKNRGMDLVSTGTYERNTVAVKGGLMRVKQGNPEAVVMVGAYAPCAEFIKLAKKIGMKDVKFCNISFVGTESLQKALGDAGEGVIVSQVWDVSYDCPLKNEYTNLLAKYYPSEKPGFISYEGFAVAKFFVEALKAAGSDLTREGLISAVESKGKFDLGGITLNYSASDHGGLQTVWSVVFTKDGFDPLEILKK